MLGYRPRTQTLHVEKTPFHRSLPQKTAVNKTSPLPQDEPTQANNFTERLVAYLLSKPLRGFLGSLQRRAYLQTKALASYSRDLPLATSSKERARAREREREREGEKEESAPKPPPPPPNLALPAQNPKS